MATDQISPDKQAVMDSFNGIEAERVAVRTQVERKAYEADIARNGLAAAVVRAQGDMTDPEVKSAARTLVKERHELDVLKATERALEKARKVVSDAIEANGALRKE